MKTITFQKMKKDNNLRYCFLEMERDRVGKKRAYEKNKEKHETEWEAKKKKERKKRNTKGEKHIGNN